MKFLRSPILPSMLLAQSKPRIYPILTTKQQSSKLFFEIPTTFAALVKLHILLSCSSLHILTALITWPIPRQLSFIFLWPSYIISLFSLLDPFSSSSLMILSAVISSSMVSFIIFSSGCFQLFMSIQGSSSTSSNLQQQLSSSSFSSYSISMFSFYANIQLVYLLPGYVFTKISVQSSASKMILQYVKGQMIALNFGRQNFLFYITRPLVERYMSILHRATSPFYSNCEMLTQKVLATSSSFMMTNLRHIFSLRAEKCRNSQSSTHIITNNKITPPKNYLMDEIACFALLK